jgi:hypothetical protein
MCLDEKKSRVWLPRRIGISAYIKYVELLIQVQQARVLVLCIEYMRRFEKGLWHKCPGFRDYQETDGSVDTCSGCHKAETSSELRLYLLNKPRYRARRASKVTLIWPQWYASSSPHY